jgi:ferritin
MDGDQLETLQFGIEEITGVREHILVEGIQEMDEDDRKKFARYAGLFKKPVATTTTQGIRDALADLIKVAVAGQDIETLALLAGWFVVASEDITIERFKRKMEAAEFIGKQEPPSNGRGGQ